MFFRSRSIIAVTVVLMLTGAAWACPSCKDSIAATDSAGTPGISGAFNSSVYIMLGAFIGVLGMVAGVIVKGIRNS